MELGLGNPDITEETFMMKFKEMLRRYAAKFVELLSHCLVDGMPATQRYCNAWLQEYLEPQLGAFTPMILTGDPFESIIAPIHAERYNVRTGLGRSDIESFIVYQDPDSNSDMETPSSAAGSRSEELILAEADVPEWQRTIPERERGYWAQTIARDVEKQERLTKENKPLQRPLSDAYKNGDVVASTSSSCENQRKRLKTSADDTREGRLYPHQSSSSSSTSGTPKDAKREEIRHKGKTAAAGRTSNRIGGETLQRVRGFIPDAIPIAAANVGIATGSSPSNMANDECEGASEGFKGKETRETRTAFQEQLRRGYQKPFK